MSWHNDEVRGPDTPQLGLSSPDGGAIEDSSQILVELYDSTRLLAEDGNFGIIEGRSMNKLLKIDNVMYRVKNLEQSASFYKNVLGLKKVWEDEERKMVAFVLEQSDTEIVIHSDPDLPDFDFSFLVENVENFCKEFQAQGRKVLFQPVDARCGKYAILADSDGNKIPIIDLTKFGGKQKYD
jgi:catechol 2,3-dioxygenase-like lactoylglutathione lyase family enzyme